MADSITLTKYSCVCLAGGQNAKAADPANHTLQVLNWALASDNSLDEESKHGEHGQPPVLDFLHLCNTDHSFIKNHMQKPQSILGSTPLLKA